MFVFLILAYFFSLSQSGIITHDHGGEDAHERATSYQNIHMEHFHAVPTYVKKEYKHLLEHPIPVGKSTSKLEVHHGGKHDHGYAFFDAHNNARGSALDIHNVDFGGHESIDYNGHSSDDSNHHDGAALGKEAGSSNSGYEVHDQNEELLQEQGHDNNLQLHGAAAYAHAGEAASADYGGASSAASGLYQVAAGHLNNYETAAVHFQNVASDHDS